MNVELTDEEWEAPLDPETEAMIDRAMADARDFYPDEQALSVKYLASEDLYVIVLKSGTRLAIPREDLQDVASASLEDASEVELGPLASSIHWPRMDVDFGVKGLADGLRGGEKWMAKLADRKSPSEYESSIAA